MPVQLMQAPQWHAPIVQKRDRAFELQLAQMNQQSSREAQEMALMAAILNIAAGRANSQDSNALARELAIMASGDVDKRLQFEERIRAGDRNWAREDADRRDKLTLMQMEKMLEGYKIQNEPQMKQLGILSEQTKALMDKSAKDDALARRLQAALGAIAGQKGEVLGSAEVSTGEENVDFEEGASQAAMELDSLNGAIEKFRNPNAPGGGLNAISTEYSNWMGSRIRTAVSKLEKSSEGKSDAFRAGVASQLIPALKAVDDLKSDPTVRGGINWTGPDFIQNWFRSNEKIDDILTPSIDASTNDAILGFRKHYTPGWSSKQKLKTSKAEIGASRWERSAISGVQDSANRLRSKPGLTAEDIYSFTLPRLPGIEDVIPGASSGSVVSSGGSAAFPAAPVPMPVTPSSGWKVPPMPPPNTPEFEQWVLEHFGG